MTRLRPLPTLLHRARRPLAALACVLAATTCTDDQGGPGHAGRGYFSFRPTYELAGGGSLAQFGIVADSVRVLLTRPVNVTVLDTTVFFPPDSTALHLALPIHLEQSPETLDAVLEIRSGGVVIFTDTVQTEILDGPPGTSAPVSAVLTFVGPGKNIASLSVTPGDTTIVEGDTLFFTATAIDSSDATVANFYLGWKSSDTLVARINAQGRLIAPNARGTVQVVGMTPTGIADTTTVTFAPAPVIVTRDSGNAQTGSAGDSLPIFLVARVKAADSLGIAGLQVQFQSVTAGGSVQTALALTDAAGRVRTRAYLGTNAGPYIYSATLVGTPLSTTFSETAAAAAPSAIALQGGNAQTDSAGRALAIPFTVRVADAFNNPVTGAKVYWTRTFGSGTVIPDSSVTDASGIATANYTLGAVGTDSIRASLAGTSAFVTFHASAINGAPATITVLLGAGQTDTVGQVLTDSLIIQVKSATGQPVVGTLTSWTVLRGGTTSPTSLNTSATGRAAVAYTLGTLPGTDSVQVQVGALSSTFTATALTGSASALAIFSGNAQTDTAGRTLALPLAVHVTDAFGNDVQNAFIAWQVIRGGQTSADTTFTDAVGQTTVTYQLGLVAGVDSVQAHLVGTAATVTFTATVEVLTASQLFLIGGNAQTDTVARTLVPMVVEAQASDARVVDSTLIRWVIASGGGSLSADSSFTDTLGRTQSTLTLPTGVGATTVLAILPGQDTVTFTATATNGRPTGIAKIGGDAQADTANAVLPIPLQVAVTDSFGNPVAGATVVYDPFAGGGSATPDTVTTDSLGHAATSFKLGATPGADSVFVAVPSTGAAVTFTATTLAAAPSGLVYVSGDTQTDTVTRTLPAPLVVQVRDGGANPVPGVAVVFSLVSGSGGPLLSGDTVVTDSAGHASVQLTLGTLVGVTSVRAVLPATADTVLFSATGVNDLPTVIALTGGSGQSVEVLHQLANSLFVQVTDAFGNNVDGSTVHWTVPAGGGTPSPDSVLTAGGGVAAATYLAGPAIGTDSVRATIGGTSAFVNIAIDVHAAPPSAIAVVSGDSQSSAIGTPFAAPLVVLVTDSLGNPTLGAQVTWGHDSGGIGNFVPDTSVTDAAGHASTSYTPDTSAGGRIIRAFLVAAPASVTFTGTALAGAPANVAVDLGDGQSDTVLSTLGVALQVLVTDGSSNPADAAPVTWEVASGSATLDDSSTVTDPAGHTAVTLTFGATSGPVTLRAILGAGVDTALFALTALPGEATAFLKISGDAQTAIVDSAVALPLVARIEDGHGNGVPGQSVSMFPIGAAGSSIDSAESVSDSGGFVRIVKWTLGSSLGADTVAMQYLLPTESLVTLVYSAIALPPGTSKSWAGTVSTDWNDPNNWSPTGVPLPSEGVYIPAAAPNYPVLTTNVSVDALTLEVGATLTNDLYILHATGPVRVGTGMIGSGELSMDGIGVTFEGTVANLIITGDVSLSASSGAQGVAIQNGHLDLAGKNATVVQVFSTSGSGYLTMNQPAETLSVGGAVTFAGGDEGGSLTAGVLRVGGDFVQFGPVADGFAVGSGFKTIFDGAAGQTIDFHDPANSQFGQLELSGAGGVQFLTDAGIQGTATLSGGPVTGAGRHVTIGGSLDDPTSTLWQVDTTEFTGAPSLPDSIHSTVILRNDFSSLSADFTITGSLIVRGASAIFTPNGHTVAVGGDLTVDTSASIYMIGATDSLLVAGNALFAGASTSGQLTNGVLSIGRVFAQAGDPAAFAPSGNHRTVFAPAVAYDSISFTDPGIALSRFQNVEFEGSSSFYRYFAGNAVVTGQMIVDFGATVYNFNSNPNGKLTVTSKLPIGNGFWSVDMLEVAGNVVVDSATNINARVTRVTGATATLDVNGAPIFLSGDLDVRNSGLVRMATVGSTLEVSGNATFGGRTTAGQLTEGTLYLNGDLTQLALTNTRSFQPSGNHTTAFIGTSEELVTFGSPGPTSSRFQDVQFLGTGGVRFGSLAVFNGIPGVFAGQVNGIVGATILGGGLVDPNFGWRVATTTFTAASAALPDSIFGSIVFTGPVNAQALKVIGSLTLSGPSASLDLDDSPHIQVTDSFVTELGGTLTMTGTSDTLDVGGSAYFTGNSFLSAGTLRVGGNFEQAGNATAFDAQPGFRTILRPSGTDTVTFANPDSTAGSGSGFADLTLDADGQRIVLASHVEVRGLFSVPLSAGTDPVLEGGGNSITVRGNDVDGLTLDRTPLQIHQTSTSDPLVVDNITFSNFLSSDTQLRVSNPGTGGFSGTFNNLTFTPLVAGNTGFYVEAQDADGVGPSFNIGINPPHPANGPSFSHAIGIASILWL